MKKAVKSFWRDETASFTVEMVMVLPILLWGYFGMFTLFEGYRSLNTNTNVAYTISDLISRETAGVDAAYITGLNELQGVLTQSRYPTILRISVVEFDDNDTENDTSDDSHTLRWSHATADPNADPTIVAFVQGDVDSKIVPHLPPMYDGEQLIVVETWMAFVPFFNITLSTLVDDTRKDVFQAFYFEGISVTRPRFASQLCWITCAT